MDSEQKIKFLQSALEMACNWLERFDSTCPQHISEELRDRLEKSKQEQPA